MSESRAGGLFNFAAPSKVVLPHAAEQSAIVRHMPSSEFSAPAAVGRPTLDVAVVMRRERMHGPSATGSPGAGRSTDVVPDEPASAREPRLLLKSDGEERWLHPGFAVELFRDDAEGYYLNVTTPAPCWFVLWRMEEEATLERRADAAARPW